ncbi:hypothetical protein [Streptomyces albidus (ex Kaewkla and Franco 2022)]|uniref:hypothetical protein n=1 Tax=Streptomyces albidus (ex Kaewkla and Franco 2022) TaxID=722709 RepID=UPI0015EE7C63|nr:hypothetical protein [Streptomyces albidus (ex Kaewkla and Franco 2022)]
MTLASTAHHAFIALASEGGGHEAEHNPVMPYLTGGGALLALLLLLWITTRFNRDR